MDLEEARTVARPPIKVGDRLTFFSTSAGPEANGIHLCLYSAQQCEVLAPIEDLDEETEPMWKVRFDNGVEAHAFEGEINGWFFDTRQWHGPFAKEE